MALRYTAMRVWTLVILILLLIRSQQQQRLASGLLPSVEDPVDRRIRQWLVYSFAAGALLVGLAEMVGLIK
jgi:ABC-type maltose transport system permease subunit